MTLGEYQTKALLTADYPKCAEVIFPTMNLELRAKELLDLVIDAEDEYLNGMKRRQIVDAIGDILWSCAAIVDDLQMSLESVVQHWISCQGRQINVQ